MLQVLCINPSSQVKVAEMHHTERGTDGAVEDDIFDLFGHPDQQQQQLTPRLHVPSTPHSVPKSQQVCQ